MEMKNFQRATEIAKQIDYYDKMIIDLELADCVDFLVRENGSQRRLLSFTEHWSNDSTLFDVVIGSILTEIRDRKNRLEKEFNEL